MRQTECSIKSVFNAESGRSTAYFYKSEATSDTKAAALRIRDALRPDHRDSAFTLIIVQPQSEQQPDWNEQNLRNRYLARLAPWSDAHVSSWDRIFREFPRVGEMRYAGY